ncbi:hypothetical protein LY76DRAFT_282633 [Colletotrichum caudatum]|nr:hypothetical protein LY76DRAFT_282633 [Colletotrichum caudatum]
MDFSIRSRTLLAGAPPCQYSARRHAKEVRAGGLGRSKRRRTRPERNRGFGGAKGGEDRVLAKEIASNLVKELYPEKGPLLATVCTGSMLAPRGFFARPTAYGRQGDENKVRQPDAVGFQPPNTSALALLCPVRCTNPSHVSA